MSEKSSMSPTGIDGHEKEQQFLSDSIRTKNLSHAYILIGEEHIGVGTVARGFASELLVCSSAHNHPDFLHLETREKITVKEMRAMLTRCHKTPLQAPRVVLYVQHAEQMGLEASNALLKTLEEPPRHLVIILQTTHADHLLPTLQSRATQLRFTRPTKNTTHDIDAWIATDGYQELDDEYRPGGSIRQQIHQWLEEGIQGSFARQTVIAKDIAKLSKQEQQNVLRWWCYELQQNLGEPSQQKTRTRQLQHILSAITTLSSTNAHPLKVIERLLLTITP